MHVCTHAPVLQYKGPHRFLFPYISSLTWAPKQHPRSNGEHFKPSSNSHAFPRNGHNEVTDTQTQIPLWLWQWTLNTEHCSNLTASLYYQLWGSPGRKQQWKNNNIQTKVDEKKSKTCTSSCAVPARVRFMSYVVAGELQAAQADDESYLGQPHTVILRADLLESTRGVP